ncbi:MAG: hypothetical protein DRI56_09920 [Chloroflexota bacterium]|nr:MAG: hypothetical protein DRI56_09920 [Chloroflexota bacterium]
MTTLASSLKSKILIIDDDPTATELLEVLLASSDYHVITTYSGEKGLEIIHQNPPDLIILDLLMPGMDGWQTCLEIRKFSNIPIIIISVITSPEIIAKTLNLGADEYLTKPVSVSMLTACVENLIRRANTEKIMRTKR